MQSEKIIVFIDGECLFCNYWVQWLIERDTEKKLLFAPLDAPLAAQLLGDHRSDSVHLYHDGKIFRKSEVLLELGKQLNRWPLGLKIFGLLPKQLRDAGYDWIAKHRHQLMGRGTCRIADKSRFIGYEQ